MNSLLELVSNSIQNSSSTAVFLDAALKSFVVLAMAGCVCLCWRRAAAATRHLIWFLAVVSLPCLPLLSSMLPSWQRPLWSVSTGFSSGNQFSMALEFVPTAQAKDSGDQGQTPVAQTVTPPGQAGRTQPMAAHFSANWLVLALAAWSGGVLLGLFSVAAARLRLRKLTRQAKVVQRTEWTTLVKEVCEELHIRRPVALLQSAENVMPMTWGWWRPVVLLPAEANEWSPERRRVVLQHELAHVKRWDCLTRNIASIVCAFYWFNPLVWLAGRRMCVERELACDDLVVIAGWKASDYASHLVEIARTFRRVPHVAAIAMARSSQLEQRVAAIVDVSRNRRLRPVTMLAVVVMTGGMVLSLGGCKTAAARGDSEKSNALRQQQITQLQAFSTAKEKQAQTLAAAAGEPVSAEFQRFFDAARSGDWQTIANMYEDFHRRHPGYVTNRTSADVTLRTSFWQPVLEICLAYDQVVRCEPEYTQIAVDGIINSIPAGSIYFGGTDPGRGLPTAFCKSHVDADPFFTLTQNALADGTFLEYLRNTYSEKRKLLSQLVEARRSDSQLQLWDAQFHQALLTLNTLKGDENSPEYKAAEKVLGDLHPKIDERINGTLAKLQFQADDQKEAGSGKQVAKSIYIPTPEESSKCFQEYLRGAEARLRHDTDHPNEPKQLKQGEDVRRIKDGNQERFQVGGPVAVMSINGLMAKLVFDKNPNKELFVEESFPLDWMYPHLSPHDLILKINRQPLLELTDEMVRRDHEYWTKLVKPMIGDWITYDTPVREVAAFAEKVYLKQNFSGFKGDPRFVRNNYSHRMFSKLRASIAGVYSWRLVHAAGEPAKARMAREADFAFHQSWALCPYSPESVNRYVDFLKTQNRIADAILIAETAARFPSSRGIDTGKFRDIAKRLKQPQKAR